MSEQLAGIGVDGAPGGWVAVACWGTALAEDPSSRRTELQFFADIHALVAWRAENLTQGDTPVAVDMPIGLPEVVSYRRCDGEARARLPGPQMPSVFQAPSRRLLICATEPLNGRPPSARDVFERARALIAEEQERLDTEASATREPPDVLRRLTQQAAGILAKVAELDEFMRAEPETGDPSREQWLVEVHPELCFRAMAGGIPPPPKTSAHGQLQRLDLVRRQFPDADARIRSWILGRKYSLLDICDAYAACWSALRWAMTGAGAPSQRAEVTPPLEVLGEAAPGCPEREPASRLAMRMVV